MTTEFDASKAMMLSIGSLFLLSSIFSYVLTKSSIVLSRRFGILDHPGPRSSHSTPVPRLGGLGILGGVCLALGLAWWTGSVRSGSRVFSTGEIWVVLVASGGLGAAGFFDDLLRFGAATKFFLQIPWVLLAVAFGIRFDVFRTETGGVIALGAWAVPITALWMLGFVNAFNFMDGINGLAAGTAVLYGTFFALFSWFQGDTGLLLVCTAVAGSCLGFLVHNFPTARTFMGDAGSLFLGGVFALSVVRLARFSESSVALIASLMVCSVFIYDFGLTLLRRLVRRENIFLPHRQHLYQKLVRAGWPHARITAMYWFLQVFMGLLALCYWRASTASRGVILAIAGSALLVLTWSVGRVERRAGKTSPAEENRFAPPSEGVQS